MHTDFEESLVPLFLLEDNKGVNYSLFKSKTFYTIVLMALVGAGNAVVPVIPTNYAAILVVVLGAVASAFHLQTGLSQTGSN